LPRMHHLTWILGVATLVLLVGRTNAQAFPGVPEPITTADLREYGDMLGLSDAQRLALQPHHRSYRERYNRLRDTDIMRLQDRVLGFTDYFRQNEFKLPPRADLEAAVEEYFGLSAKVDRVDATLFARMQSILTDSQRQRMPRVLAAREAQVYGLIAYEFVGELNPAAEPRLSDMVLDLDLDPDVLDLMNDDLFRYERGMVSQMKTARSTLRDTAIYMLDAIDRLGLRDMSVMEIGEYLSEEANEQQLRDIFDIGSAPVQKIAHETAQYNRRAAGRLAEALPEAKGRELLERYHRRAYAEAYRNVPEWRAPYLDVLQLPSLDSEIRAAVRAQLQSYSARDDSMVKRIADMIDEHREFRSSMDFENEDEGEGEYIETLQAEVDKRIALAETAKSNLDAMLDAETRDSLRIMRNMDDGASSARADVQVVQSGENVEITLDGDGTTTVRATPSTDLFVIDPMSKQTYGELISALGVSDDDRVILDVIYSDYATAYDEACTELQSVIDAGGDESEPVATRVRGISEKRRATVETLMAADATLFDGVQPFVPPANMEELHHRRMMRMRENLVTVTRRQASTWGMLQVDGEALVELDDLDPIRELDPASTDGVRETLDDYAEMRLAQLRELANAASEHRMMYEMFTMATNSSEERSDRVVQAMRERWEEKQAAVRRKGTVVADMNRAALMEVREQLDPQTAADVSYAFNMIAYPDLYAEANVMQTTIEETPSLPNLAEHQRNRVVDLAGEFRGRFDEIASALVGMRRDRAQIGMPMEMPSRAFIEREIAMERLRFERGELISETRERLRLVLTPDQRSVVLASNDQDNDASEN